MLPENPTDPTASLAPAVKPEIPEMQAQYALIEASKKAAAAARAQGGDPHALAALAAQPLTLGALTFPLPTIGTMLAQQKAYALYSKHGEPPNLLLTAACFHDASLIFSLVEDATDLKTLEKYLFDLGLLLPVTVLPKLNAWVNQQLGYLGGADSEEDPAPLARTLPTEPASAPEA